MTTVRANGIDLEYDEFGDAANPAILLIMGLGGQMIWWDEDFCARLADRSYRVIRFDNRDIGRSTKFDDTLPHPGPLVQDAMKGKRVEPPYTLRDMAADAVGLLDSLGIERAHVVGASMGGMIAQRIAIHFPERVATVTSIMSSTGNPGLPQAAPEVTALLTTPPPSDPAAAIEHGVDIWRILHGAGHPFDEERVRRRIVESSQRSRHLTGQPRQLLAIIADGDRRTLLKQVSVPTLVIHGDADPLVPYAAGIDTAENVPGAKMVTIEGMGHEMPPGAWPQLIDAIAGFAAAAS